VRRVLQLAGGGGIELYERIEAIFSALPKVDWPAAHTLSDQLALAAQEQRFDAFYNLLLDLMARLIRVRASGNRDAPEFTVAQRLIPEAKLPAWAALWEAILREREDTVLLNLDRRALIIGTLERLEALARP
jgi:DNA polymerase III subunit delta'